MAWPRRDCKIEYQTLSETFVPFEIEWGQVRLAVELYAAEQGFQIEVPTHCTEPNGRRTRLNRDTPGFRMRPPPYAPSRTQFADYLTAIAAAVEAATLGLKNKNTELLGSLRTTKTELDGFKSQFEGLDIAAVKGLLTKVGQDEETKLIAEGKLDEVITRRTERLRTDYDTKLAAEKARADKAEQFAAKYSDKVLADSIRAAAIKAGALPEAAEDIILRARGTFKLSEDGEAIATDRDGEVVYGKDGKTPLSPLEWAESLRCRSDRRSRWQGHEKVG
eukprot:gene5151-7885_t